MGYDPLPTPCRGKQCFLEGWPGKIDTPIDEIQAWGVDHPQWSNTGINTTHVAGLDIDLLDPEAAEAVRQKILDRFGDRGVVLERTGRAPKFLVPFRVTAPFAKLTQRLRAPNGDECRIEFLCEGQQFIADGLHQDTGQPYTWRGGDPTTTPRDELPEVSPAEAREFFQDICNALIDELHYRKIDGGNGQDTSQGDETIVEHCRVDVEAELAAIRTGTCNDVQIKVVPALVWRGLDLDDIHRIVLDATIRGVYPEWAHKSRDQLGLELRQRMLSTMRNLFTNEYDPTTGVVPPWLHSTYHAKWIEVLKAGGRPIFSYNRFGFCVRPAQEPIERKDSPSIVPADETKADTKGPSGLFTLPQLEPFDFTQLEGFDFLYGKHHMRGVVTGTVAPGGSGKSSYSMVEAVAMASGRDLLGEVPVERIRVWYHGGEDPMKILKLRLAAICIHYGIPIEELCGWLFMTSGTEFPLRVAVEGYTKLDINHVLLARIGEEIERNEISCVIFDPFVKMHRISEQDNNRIDQIASEFGALADKYQCAIDLVHHTRKRPPGSTAELGVDDTRGAGALKDALRSVRMLNPISGNDAVGIPEAERHRYFRVGLVKANHTVMTDTKQIYRLHTVTIPNLQQSEVGVVTAWQGRPGASGEFAENMRRAEEVFMAILRRVTLRGSPRVSDLKGSNYAPRIFAGEPEAKEAGMGEGTLAEAMKQLLAAGQVEAVDGGRGGKHVHKIVPVGGVLNPG
jgi:hypothetical protein